MAADRSHGTMTPFDELPDEIVAEVCIKMVSILVSTNSCRFADPGRVTARHSGQMHASLQAIRGCDEARGPRQSRMHEAT